MPQGRNLLEGPSAKTARFRFWDHRGLFTPVAPEGEEKAIQARKRLKKHPTGYTQDQIASDLLLLESHHSKPVYRVRQVMSGWNTSGWKGQYWGTRKSRGRNQSTSNVPKDKPKEKETNQFPTYDTMVVGQTEQAASAASSSKRGLCVAICLAIVASVQPGPQYPSGDCDSLGGQHEWHDSGRQVGALHAAEASQHEEEGYATHRTSRSSSAEKETSGCGFSGATEEAIEAGAMLRRTTPGEDVVPPSHFSEVFNTLHKGAEVAEGMETAHGHDYCADARYQPA